MFRHLTLLIFIFLFVLNSKAEAYQDSLLGIWNNPSINDNERCNALFIYLDNTLEKSSDGTENSLELSFKLKDFSKRIGNHNIKAKAHYLIGSFYLKKENYKEALLNYKKSLTDLKDEKKIDATLNIGLLFLEREVNYDSAIAYYQKALKISRKLEAKQQHSKIYNLIGKAYYRKSDYTNAIRNQEHALEHLDTSNQSGKENYSAILTEIGNLQATNQSFEKSIYYHKRSLAIRKNLDTSNLNVLALIAWSNNDIGFAYHGLKNEKKALEYYKKSLWFWNKITSKEAKYFDKVLTEIGKVYLNMGASYYIINRHNKAYTSCIKAYEIFQNKYEKQIDKRNQITEPFCNVIIAVVHFFVENEDFEKALNMLQKHEKMLKKVNKHHQKDISYYYYKIFKNTNQPRKALHYHENYKRYNDTIFNNNKIEAINSLDLRLKAKKDSIINEHEKEIAKINFKNQLIEEEKNQTKLIFGCIALLILCISGFIAFRQKKKANHLISLQKQIVEEKNKDIIDSMNYARRIQSAILPPNKFIKEHLPKSFILYLPKDIVAGDFYWMEKLDETIFFAVADCTGHGIPGAMVSVVGNNALNRAVREHKLTKPGEILDKSREILIKEFEKSEEEVKDGMDISLCAINGNQLEFAGAYNPVFIARNGELTETRGDSQPIGKFDHKKAFKTHQFTLQKGDVIYIFSDGFSDQFGGKKGKKFKKANFKKLLLSIEDQPMSEQKEIIEKEFQKWKGQLEQIDDVCVMGVKI